MQIEERNTLLEFVLSPVFESAGTITCTTLKGALNIQNKRTCSMVKFNLKLSAMRETHKLQYVRYESSCKFKSMYTRFTCLMRNKDVITLASDELRNKCQAVYRTEVKAILKCLVSYWTAFDNIAQCFTFGELLVQCLLPGNADYRLQWPKLLRPPIQLNFLCSRKVKEFSALTVAVFCFHPVIQRSKKWINNFT